MLIMDYLSVSDRQLGWEVHAQHPKQVQLSHVCIIVTDRLLVSAVGNSTISER